VTFNNWSSADYGAIGFAESLEISCNTFYFQLGWELETRFGVSLESGDETEKFQDYLHKAGFGEPTGVDLPFEGDGLVPDKAWLDAYCETAQTEGCQYGWLPGYTVNMSIGQGSLEATPLQMANAYSSIVNGGDVLVPHIGTALGKPAENPEEADIGDEPVPALTEPEPSLSPSVSPSPSPSGATPTSAASPADATDASDLDVGEDVAPTPERIIKTFKTEVARQLPLDAAELAVLRAGLEDVVSGANGTAVGAFSGFPLERVQVAGKTGTAQIGGTDFNRAWFVGYAPADEPEYVISVYMNYAGHGGESAAPVAREIFEGIFNIDDASDVQVTAGDVSG
jgi:penicillin-binding protein 2